MRGIPVEKVISDVMLADQPTKKFVKPEDIAGEVGILHAFQMSGLLLLVGWFWGGVKHMLVCVCLFVRII